jgi:signal transduction histidine kinase
MEGRAQGRTRLTQDGSQRSSWFRTSLWAATLLSSTADAAELPVLSLERIHESQGVAGLSMFAGLVLFSTITALLHLTARKRWTQREYALSQELTDVRAKLDRASVFLSAEPQIVVAWNSAAGEPDIEGDLSLVADSPAARRVLGFGSWLAPSAAQQMDRCVERLRGRGEGFRMALSSLAGRHLEAEGLAVAGRAILRIRDVSGDRLELTRLRERYGKTLADLDALRALLDAVPNPVWMRDGSGQLAWVNSAYVRAVEAKDALEAVARKIELLDRPARAAAATARKSAQLWRAHVNAIVAGSRHTLDIIDVPSSAGSVGIASDLSELEAARTDLVRQMESHARTLDQLTTAVAIFDRSKRLVFHNAAYRQLWPLEAPFLDQHPSDGEILDRLRADRRLPEQADFRTWKAGLLAAYQAVETSEQVWHLPDGRTLRAVTNPNPQGGVTYLFDDVTERFHLESKYNALYRVQSETLDSLKEGVAVFGTDGRLNLFNPAFAEIWRLDGAELNAKPHIDTIARRCEALCADTTTWARLRSIVAGLQDGRTGFTDRIVRGDGSFLDGAAAPLPDGATLLTFTDVTAGVNVERALKERNQALMDAEKLRNDFVHHVSYELRSPLTNIIGFSELLGDGAIGTLNEKQREYCGYIMKSSSALLAIITDILDLATIDKDAMELSLSDVDIQQTIAAAVQGIQDRLVESSLHLQVVVLDDIGTFRADGKRVRQILFNLLSNAIGFSDPEQTVTLAAMRRDDEVVFKVSDQGRGIAPEVLDRVFDRFESHTVGSRHRGVGLGLSIVRAFVELHGGQILIDSAPGEGTTVTCIFPVPVEPAARVTPPQQEDRRDGAAVVGTGKLAHRTSESQRD